MLYSSCRSETCFLAVLWTFHEVWTKVSFLFNINLSHLSAFVFLSLFHLSHSLFCHLLCVVFRPHHTSRPQRTLPDASRLLWPFWKSSRGSPLKVRSPVEGMETSVLTTCGLTFFRRAQHVCFTHRRQAGAPWWVGGPLHRDISEQTKRC